MAQKGIGSAKPRKGNNDSAKLEEVIDIYKFQDHPDEWVRIRLLEKGLIAVRRHWCKIAAGKTKKLVTVPRFCISFDPENESEPKAGVVCPYCEADTGDRDTSPVTSEFFYLTNAIIRDLQEDEPARKAEPTSKEKKTGIKDIKSKSWTPVRVVRLTNGVVSRIQELGETNIVKDKKSGKKKSFDLSHVKYGVDINVKFKPKASGSEKYSVDKADDGRCAITEEENEYLVFELSEGLLDLCGRMDPKQAKEDFKRMELVGGEEVDDEEDEDDEVPLKKKKKKSKFDDDEDEDDVPKKKKKSKFDDDEDEKSSKKKSKSGKKKKSKFDDDDDDEKPSKKKSKKSKSDDDEDEDDVPKKKKKSSKFDDDEDEKSSKKSKSSDKKKSKSDDKKSKSGKKKSSKFDEDDDNW